MLVPSQMNHTGTACGRPSGRVVLIQMERSALSGKSTLFQGMKPDMNCLLCLLHLIAFLGYLASYSGAAKTSSICIVLPLLGLTEIIAIGVSSRVSRRFR